MEYYGHIDSSTPSLTISLLPGYRGLGIGTQLLDSLLFLLRENGYLIQRCACMSGRNFRSWRKKTRNI